MQQTGRDTAPAHFKNHEMIKIKSDRDDKANFNY